MRVLLATLRFIAVGPVADDFADVVPRALREGLRGSFARPSLLHFRQEFLPAVSASFAHVFHRFTDGVIHPQGLANFSEQRRIIGTFINEIVSLLLERHVSRLARSRPFPQPRVLVNWVRKKRGGVSNNRRRVPIGELDGQLCRGELRKASRASSEENLCKSAQSVDKDENAGYFLSSAFGSALPAIFWARPAANFVYCALSTVKWPSM